MLATAKRPLLFPLIPIYYLIILTFRAVNYLLNKTISHRFALKKTPGGPWTPVWSAAVS